MSGLLAGVRVLDLSGLLPGPFATLMLADLGAEVIKVESRLGDLARQVPPRAAGQGAWFQAYNRNKRSLGLDLRKPAGRAVFMDLVWRSDVVVESFRPGRAERMGAGPDACRAANPRLVYCSLSGFGHTGPDTGRSGHDITYLARTGALTLFRDSAGRPLIPPLQIADLSAGVTAALAIVAALFDRTRTGEGCVLDIGLLDSVLPWMAGYLAAAHAGVHLGEAGATPLSGRYPFYQVYETADGGWVAVGALEPLFWSDLCAALGRPDLTGLQFGDEGEQARVRSALGTAFAARPAAEWAALFRERNLAAEVVADLGDVAADPQLAARNLLAVVPYAGGEVLHVGSPFHAPGHPAPPPAQAPRLGADTRAVLAEVLGLPDDAIDDLVAERAVFGAEDAAPRQIAPDEIP